MAGMAELKTKPRKTVQDYMSLPEGTLAELIEGELFMSPAPTMRHNRIVEALFRLLDAHVRARRLGEIHAHPMDVHLPSKDVVQPDVMFIRSSNLSILQDWVRGTPDLLIEVVSPDSRERDRIVKRDLYARNGVREYWIVDPGYANPPDPVRSRRAEGCTVEVFRLRSPLDRSCGGQVRLAGSRPRPAEATGTGRGGGYKPAGYFEEADRVVSATFPALAMTVRDLLR